MVRKGNLAVSESSNISKTGEATPTKISVHVHRYLQFRHKWVSVERWKESAADRLHYHSVEKRTQD